MTLRRSTFSLAAFALTATLSTGALAAGVNVLTAWYGQSCGAAHGNVTSPVKSRCDGRSPCQYVVDTALLGDPAPGCRKNFIVVYACEGQSNVRLAQLPGEAQGEAILLGCGPEFAPGRPDDNRRR